MDLVVAWEHSLTKAALETCTATSENTTSLSHGASAFPSYAVKQLI